VPTRLGLQAGTLLSSFLHCYLMILLLFACRSRPSLGTGLRSRTGRGNRICPSSSAASFAAQHSATASTAVCTRDVALHMSDVGCVVHSAWCVLRPEATGGGGVERAAPFSPLLPVAASCACAGHAIVPCSSSCTASRKPASDGQHRVGPAAGAGEYAGRSPHARTAYSAALDAVCHGICDGTLFALGAAAERQHENGIAGKPSSCSTAVGLLWGLHDVGWPTVCPHCRQDMRHGEYALRRAMAEQRQRARPAATRRRYARTVRTPSDGTLQCCSDAW
jgi:hypothetical protein